MPVILLSITLVILLINVGVGVLLWQRYKKLQSASAELQTLISNIDPGEATLPPDIGKILGHGKRRILCIEILNPVELAVTQNKLAGPVASLAPEYINQQVYQQTQDILTEKLQEFGVQAEISIQSIQ